MGTRASFFVGDPRKADEREWLGCVAWDGYPEGFDDVDIKLVATEHEFRNMVKTISGKRDDFSDPVKGSFPFPWIHDIFLTDYTYAYFDGALRVTSFHHGFSTIEEYYIEVNKEPDDDEDYLADPTLKKVSINLNYDRNQPDSIMILGVDNI